MSSQCTTSLTRRGSGLAVGAAVSVITSRSPLSAPQPLHVVADRDVRVLSPEGEILRQLMLDPSRKYPPLG